MWKVLTIFVLVAPLACFGGAAQPQPPAFIEQNAFVNAGIPQQSGVANQKFVPEEVAIRAGGIVNFATVSNGLGSTSGAHPVAVYRVAQGTTLSALRAQITNGDVVLKDAAGVSILNKTEVNAGRIESDPSSVRHFLEVPPSPLSSARIVGVYFSEPALYLTICQLQSHYTNGMLALVSVV